jgi:poly(beta-D-mannuronate) lyase
MRVLALACTALAWLAGCGPNSSAALTPAAPASDRHALRAPFDVEARRALVGVALPDPAAREVEVPQRDLEGVSYYTDASKSVADPGLKEQNVQALKPVRRFVAGVVELADGWLRSRPANLAYAARAVATLAAWADARALLGTVNPQGEYEREWTLGSLSLAYLKVKEAPGLDAAKLRAIEGWLTNVAASVVPYYERPKLKSNSNNHAYWAGMAVAAAGIAGQDRALFDWGLARARIGVALVDARGLLPLELERRALALHYHVFALAPLVMLAEMAEANGIGLYDEGDRAISRLAERVIEGLTTPAVFSDLAGIDQTIELPPAGSDIGWAEAYFARFRASRLAPWLLAARPVRDVRLGGDMTAAFGVVRLDAAKGAATTAAPR